MNKIGAFLGIAVVAMGCMTRHRLPGRPIYEGNPQQMKAVVEKLDTISLEKREAYLKREILGGNVPDFLRKFSKVTVNGNTISGKKAKVVYFVTTDYLSIGNDEDFFRIPLTPQTAQAIADSLHCFLPTRKMVDDIYQAATVKLEPHPLTEERERVAAFFRHHALIEQQRQGKKGLIAGIKKDVVISSAIENDPRPNRVAIYGWHRLDGEAIQPLYTGHVDWYVDYSHGIRLVYEMIKVNGKWLHYTAVLKDPELSALLCDEEACDFTVYD